MTVIALPRRPIRTERLRLLPASTSQAPELVTAIAESRVQLARFLPWAEHNRFEDTLRAYAGMERAWLEGTAFNFAIELEGALCGMVSLRRNPNQAAEGDVGYWIAAPAGGRGLMTEATLALLQFGFHAVGLHRIELRTHVDNRASQRVAEKVGMWREARVRGALMFGDGNPQDGYLYGTVATDPRRDTGQADAGRTAGVPELTEPDFSRGLVTAVVQDEADGTLLMVAHMDPEAYRKTRETGHAWFWSRSRKRLWEKGETSGNFLVVSSVVLDCDGDAVLLRVAPAGPACHTGARTCFHNPV